MPLPGQASSHLLHKLHSMRSWRAFGKNREQFAQHRCVGVRKKLLGFGRQSVEQRGFATSAPRARLVDQAVSFQREQVCSDCVVRQMKLLSQFIDSVTGTAEQQDYASARAGEKMLIPGQQCSHLLSCYSHYIS